MVKQVKIERFKSISSATLDLSKINVLVGTNNAGKSSVLQALQFATSVAQTAKTYSQNVKFDKNGVWATSVYPDQLVYSPVKDPYTLAQGGVLKEDSDLGIAVSFLEDSGDIATATFRKGRNKNIAARFEGANVGQKLASLEAPFCMYVPGLAGIPFEEEIRTVGVVRRIAAKGDSNTVFRNVINLLSQDHEGWCRFLTDIKVIFPEIEFEINARPEVDGFIDIKFRLTSSAPLLPIDLAGTGVLQATQIAAYVNYFKPALLLLDEPDSHLHPDNQRALATLLVSISDKTQTTVLISTHSRHLMAALQEDAKFFLVKNGTVSNSEYNHYIGLLELGALDEYDHIRNGDLKYIILTEDSSETSHKYLRGILEASGYARDEFQIYSYNSVTKIDSAKMFAQFLLDINPDLRIIVYRDRDGLYDDEVSETKRAIEFDSRVTCVISKFNDVEMYYCDENHVCEICNRLSLPLTISEAQEFLLSSINEQDEKSKNKFFTHRLSLNKNKSDGSFITIAQSKYDENKRVYAYGKTIAGVLKSKLQQKFGRIIDLYQVTPYLSESQFSAVVASNHS